MSTKWIAVFVLAAVTAGCGGGSHGGATVNTPAASVVPNVVGQDVDAARTALTGSGWSVDVERVGLDKVDSSKPKPGTVVAQEPNAGSSAPAASSIHLSVIPEYAVVPDLAKLQRDDAMQQLTDLGLKVVLHDEPRGDTPAGQVTGTNPAAGSVVGPGSSITLSVASKPADKPVTVLVFIDLSTGTKRLGNGTCGTEQPTSLVEGAEIELWSAHSTRLGTALLSGGTITSGGGCEFTGRFDNVFPAASYTLLVGSDISFQEYSFADAKANGFRLYYTYP